MVLPTVPHEAQTMAGAGWLRACHKEFLDPPVDLRPSDGHGVDMTRREDVRAVAPKIEEARLHVEYLHLLLRVLEELGEQLHVEPEDPAGQCSVDGVVGSDQYESRDPTIAVYPLVTDNAFSGVDAAAALAGCLQIAPPVNILIYRVF